MGVDLRELNDEQRAAVTMPEDTSVLVVAGAGTGKTKTMAYRIAYLIDAYNVQPHSILAITFTNKAAAEMKERIHTTISKSNIQRKLYGDVSALTFHKFGLLALRRFGAHVGLKPNFTIYDRGDCESLMKNIMRENSLESDDWKPNNYLHEISKLKNSAISNVTNETVGNQFGTHRNRVVTMYNEYRRHLQRSNAVDFDDLLLKLYELLSNEEIGSQYARWFPFVHLDEYQDTNRLQFMILDALRKFEKKPTVFAVGDADQTIYSWRGARIENILNFEHNFSPSVAVFLKQNYRSTPNILRAAGAVIQNNRERHNEKSLVTTRKEGEKLRVLMANDGNEEAELVLNWFADQGMNCTSAVLYRTNAQSRVFEELCVRKGLSYTVVGSLRFYERREVKDALCYFRALIGEGDVDDVSFVRMLSTVTRGVGKTSLDKLREFAQSRNMTLFQAAREVDFKALFQGRYPKGLDTFTREIVERQAALQGGLNPLTLIRQWLLDCGFFLELRKSDEGSDRVRNVEELLDGFARFMEENPESGVATFLENVALQSDADRVENDKYPLALITIHAAKGLEFDQVAVCGLEDGLFPLRGDMAEDLEEERRLFYVAITRARTRVALSLAAIRTQYGHTDRTMPSRFLKELPPDELSGNLYAGYTPQKFPTIAAQPKTVPTKSTPRNSGTSYSNGQRVQHPVFGEGRIVNAIPAEGGYKVLVDFLTAGPKTILTKFVQLTPLEKK